jgi:hypothetical protein
VNQFAVLAAIAALVMLFVLAEIAAAVLPLIIVLTLVPPAERQALAELMAACDSSHKLRLWTALRAAVKARRIRRLRAHRSGTDSTMNRPGGLETPFDRARDNHLPVNPAGAREPSNDQPQSPAGNQPFDPTGR